MSPFSIKSSGSVASVALRPGDHSAVTVRLLAGRTRLSALPPSGMMEFTVRNEFRLLKQRRRNFSLTRNFSKLIISIFLFMLKKSSQRKSES